MKKLQPGKVNNRPWATQLVLGSTQTQPQICLGPLLTSFPLGYVPSHDYNHKADWFPGGFIHCSFYCPEIACPPLKMRDIFDVKWHHNLGSKSRKEKEGGRLFRQSTWKNFCDRNIICILESALKIIRLLSFFTAITLWMECYSKFTRDMERSTRVWTFRRSRSKHGWGPGRLTVLTPPLNAFSPTSFHINNSLHGNNAWLPRPKPRMAFLQL